MSTPLKDVPTPAVTTTGVTQDFTQIILTCPSDLPNGDALCAAMKSALQTRAPNLSVQIGPDASAPNGVLAITLKVTKINTQVLEGHLEWHSAAIAVQSGPPVALEVIDTTLNTRMFGQFTAGLIHLAELPL